jgi:hypothetical protein
MKKLFIIVTFVLGLALVAMVLTKPEPKEHYDAMIGLAQNVVDQEVTSDNVKKTMAQMGAEKLAEFMTGTWYLSYSSRMSDGSLVLVDKEIIGNLKLTRNEKE